MSYPAGEPGVTDLGSRHFSAVYAWLEERPMAWRWWHDCPAVGHVSWNWIGDALDGRRSGHVIVSIRPLTVTGSLLCEDCGDHGYITEDRWVAA